MESAQMENLQLKKANIEDPTPDSEKSVVLHFPFFGLHCDNIIATGFSGHVFRISDRIAFKPPPRYDPDAPEICLQREEESVQSMKQEQEIYGILGKNPHPNIVRAILCVPEGTFMEFMPNTLKSRITNIDQDNTVGRRIPTPNTIPPALQEKWIRQLISANVWLTSLGLAHGDLRPENILVSADDTIKLVDFNAAVRIGEQLEAGPNFAKFEEGQEEFGWPLANIGSLQWILGTYFYYIGDGGKRWKKEDWTLATEAKWKAGEFPDTEWDAEFGTLIRDCWSGAFESVEDIEKAAEEAIAKGVERRREIGGNAEVGLEDDQTPTVLTDADMEALVLECERFMRENQIKDEPTVLTDAEREALELECQLMHENRVKDHQAAMQ